ncbi:MAG: hypothetical protein JRJ06_03625 [Deltaproteobacteria bacterium]|nr:hypothetical protein [Deltaproteobacteria bacterium]
MVQNGLKGIFDSIEMLSRAKLQAESRVKLIKTMREDEEITASDNRRMTTLYDEARAHVNSGIDRLLVELETTGKVDDDKSFEEIASRAAQQVEAFVTESDQLVFGEDRSGMVEAGLGLAGILVGAMVNVWKNLRGARKVRHSKLVKRIDDLRWPAFDEL